MSGCPVCGGEGRVYRMTTAYETMATQAAGSSFSWTGQTHEWRTCHACGGSGLLSDPMEPVADEPRCLLRDTPEAPEILAAAIGAAGLTPLLKDGYAISLREATDAIIAALREPRRYPESGDER